MFGIRRFHEWLPVAHLINGRLPPGCHGAVGYREVGGKGPVHIQYYRRRPLKGKEGEGRVGCEGQEQDGEMVEYGGSEDGETDDSDSDDDNGEEWGDWVEEERKRIKRAEDRVSRKEWDQLVRESDEDYEGQVLEMDYGDDDSGEAAPAEEEEAPAGLGELYEQHRPEEGEVVACFTNAAFALRGHGVGVGKEENLPNAAESGVDGFFLWRCSGEVVEGDDGVNYLRGYPYTVCSHLPNLSF